MLNRPHSLFFSVLNAASLVAIIWLVWLAQLVFGWQVRELAVEPLQLFGLLGVVFGPLIHVNFEHLISNTLPLFILLSALLYGYPASRWRAFALIWMGSGIGVWLFGREAVHYGASGLTHGLFFFLLLASILRRDKRSIVLMCIAFFLYGGMVMSVLPQQPSISYEYHFFGAVWGVIAALVYRRADPLFEEPSYEWEGIESGGSEDDLIGDEWRLKEQPEAESDPDKP